MILDVSHYSPSLLYVQVTWCLVTCVSVDEPITPELMQKLATSENLPNQQILISSR